MQGDTREAQEAAPVEQTPPPRPELRPEIKSIVERNWKRDEEALRYLAS